MKALSEHQRKKTQYRKPVLRRFGQVRDLTLSGSLGNPEGGSDRPDKKTGFSDRRLKSSIHKVGQHPDGYGLYLFEFNPSCRDLCGHGRQFGVMADEVELIKPNAVFVSENGYKKVDYALLGITRFIH